MKLNSITLQPHNKRWGVFYLYEDAPIRLWTTFLLRRVAERFALKKGRELKVGVTVYYK